MFCDASASWYSSFFGFMMTHLETGRNDEEVGFYDFVLKFPETPSVAL